MMNVQFYWSKFIELLTNVMGKVYTARRAETTHMHFSFPIVYYAVDIPEVDIWKYLKYSPIPYFILLNSLLYPKKHV